MLVVKLSEFFHMALKADRAQLEGMYTAGVLVVTRRMFLLRR